ncbi:putative DNA-binding domain-containing protein [Marichromatium gracile]|uniref:HvfC family RiPP maturation protein n=1 Tax=Marichromatium gracile TaxID=1048 RepID=UPI001F1D9774|nr:putative DNA-binding domain-containing protein [Marichromatium gracile]MCF1183244.1 putative DNA-binding domain-containing protein [Marichromatium gracile]
MAEFAVQQQAFCAHLRDPARADAPADVAPERMRVYRELIFNNLDALLAGSFPVLHRILDPARWRALVRDFLVGHRARTPLFHRLPGEFVDFLGQRPASADDPPFLLELAHYEWIEIALYNSEAEPDLDGLDPNGDLLAATPVRSPLAWPLSYRFPVHRIAPDHLPEAPSAEPVQLVVLRDRTQQVRFIEINAVTQRLLQRIETSPTPSGREALLGIAAELRHPEPERVVAFGAETLARLRAEGVLLGTRPTPVAHPA